MNPFSATPSRRAWRWYIGIIGLLLLLMILDRITEAITVGVIDNRWEEIGKSTTAQRLERAVSIFQKYQASTNVVSMQILNDTTFSSDLSQPPDIRDTLLFSYLHDVERPENWSIEVYDSASHLIAWKGRSIPIGYRDIDSALSGKTFSMVSSGAVYSYLSVVAPLKSTGARAVVVVSRTVEISYPFNNRFLASSGIQERVRQVLGEPVEYIFEPINGVVTDSGHVTADLMSIDGRKIGTVVLPTADKAEYLVNVHLLFDRIFDGLVIALSLVLLVMLLSITHAASPWRRFLALSGALWIVRYAWIQLAIPELFFEYGIFSPMFFASPFGYGLAQSLGDLLITIIVVFLQVLLGLLAVIDTVHRGWTVRSRSIAAGAVFVSPLISSLVIRGYASAIWSAVFDSTITFNDPTTILPGFTSAIMECALLILTMSLILFLISFFLVLSGFLQSAFGRERRRITIVMLGFWLLLGGAIYGELSFTQLISQWLRAGVTLATFAVAVWIQHVLDRGTTIVRFRRLTYLVVGSVLLLLVVRDDAVYQRDREKVQALALELIRPADVWMEHLISDVAKSASGDDDVIKALNNELSDDKRMKVAFTTWAQSILSREGYNSAVVVLDTSKRVVSQFDIGIENVIRSGFSRQLSLLEQNNIGSLQVQSTRLVGDLSMYECYAPVISPTKGRLGTVYVNIVASHRAYTRTDNPEILRSGVNPTLETSFQGLIFSEYTGGVMVSSTDETMPRERTLPAEVVQAMRAGNPSMIWVHETVNDRRLRTLYVPMEDASHGSVLGISLVDQDIGWKIFIASKLMLLATLLTAAVVLAAIVLYVLRHGRPRVTFRTKLLFGLFCVSLVPLVILNYVNGQIMVDQSRRSVQRELARELDIVVSNLMSGISAGDNTGWQLIDDVRCQQVAMQTGIDFYLFNNGRLEATSRPELFVSELVDLRISADAYSRTVIEGDNFFSEESTIGRYPYTTGYRPIRNKNGEAVMVVAVPTITRQSGIEQDLVMVTGFLFAGYFVSAFFIVIAGSVIAHRITLPLRALRSATQDIARGRYDFSLDLRRNDEIGELVQSFNSMARELTHSREQLAKAERELAWKEMAKQVAHEIKNPLTPMKLSIQHLRQAYTDNVENFSEILQRVTKTIIEQIEALSRIASEFSNFARMPKRNPEQCDVNDMLDETVSLFEDEKRIAFQRKFNDTMPPVFADREELRRAFVNILRNAVQAIPQTGTITVRTVVEGEQIVIDIHDTGVGIPDEIRDKLFEPSFSTKTDGMGLGLALVKKTIGDLHGTIAVVSSPGDGTRVTIRLPAVHPANH